MGETLHLLFHSCSDGSYELHIKESWSGRTACANFVPPYTGKQLNTLQKKLNLLTSSDRELRVIGQRLFLALCGTDAQAQQHGNPTQPVQAVLHSVIQRTLKRRGTVALILSFGPGCDTFVRYPWELLHNGDHFLLASGIFTLSRVLVRPDAPGSSELPVHPPFRVLYISSSPTDCAPLETERSFEALQEALYPLIDTGQVFLDRLEPPTFGQLVRYFNSFGGASMLDDNETVMPCYVVHFDGHGAYGRLCPDDACAVVNDADAHKCSRCNASLARVKSQTYLCFCNEDGSNRYIDTQSLRDLFLSSDLRLAVFSACETASISEEPAHSQQQHAAVDATLATALVTAQVPAVVAMPFSLQDDLSPTFMLHFYEALADGRTLEEALARARQALLPMQQKSWFIPVLYRNVPAGEEGPVALISKGEIVRNHEHPLSHLGPPATFIGRERELKELDAVISALTSGERKADLPGQSHFHNGDHLTHHIALTGPGGIGKSSLAFEVINRNREKFLGGIVGVSLQNGKAFTDALFEMVQYLHIPVHNMTTKDAKQRARLVQGSLRSLASRGLPCLLLIDSFEEVKDPAELETWFQFLSTLPQEITVLVTSRLNPENMLIVGGSHCRWYDYPVGKMQEADLFKLFLELAAANGLGQRIHLDDIRQQQVLREICTLLDGYPLGAELIFGTARSIGGKVFTPEAATRSLEEVRDDLRETPLAGILAVLEVSYRRLNPPTRLFLSYLAVFKLPFSRDQIMMLINSGILASTQDDTDQTVLAEHSFNAKEVQPGSLHELADLAQNWRSARDELVQASFIQFDGHVYTIHPQVSHFALLNLPAYERQRIHRIIASYYYNRPQPGAEEWFAAFDHLESAGKPQDLQEAVHVAIRASWALAGRGHTLALQTILQRALVHASHLNDQTGQGQIHCCLGAIFRQAGQYATAKTSLLSSLACYNAPDVQVETAWAHYELAMLALESGDPLQARDCAQAALTLFRTAHNDSGQAWIHLLLGEVQRGNGDYQAALQYFDLAYTTFLHLQERSGQASILRARGNVHEATGHYKKALQDYETASQLFTADGLPIEQAWVLVDKALVYLDMALFVEAEKACVQAATLFREQNVQRGTAWTLRVMGDLAIKKHEQMQARGYYEEAHALFNTLGSLLDQAAVLNALGSLELTEGQFLTASDLFEQAHTIAATQSARQINAQALRGLGEVEQALHHFDAASRYYQYATSIANDLDTPAERAALLQRQGTLYATQKQYSDALEVWVQALAYEQRLGHFTHTGLQEQVHSLVSEQHLEVAFKESCERFGLASN